MRKRWLYIALPFLAATASIVSCKKEYSSDEVLPTSYSPSVVVGNNNNVLYALNPQTGEKNWEIGLSSPVIASPILLKGSVYACSSQRDTLYKIDAKTGKMLRKITFAGGDQGVIGTPIADGKLIYIPTYGGKIVAIDTTDFTEKWSYAIGGNIESSPTVHNGNIYIANTVGNVYCFEKTNGNTTGPGSSASPTWTLSVTGAKFVSSPAIAEPYLYVGSMSDSNMYCVYLNPPGGGGTGALRWTYKCKGGIKSSPAAYGGTCIFGANDFRLYCLDTTIDPMMGITVPEPRWIDTFMTSEITSSPFAYNQTIYVGCKDYKVYALKVINGAPKWIYSTNGIITSSPLVYSGTVYVGSFDKYLYALDTGRGTLKWKTNTNGQIESSPMIDDFTKTTGFNSQISGLTN